MVARPLEGAIIIITPLFLSRIMAPSNSVSFSEPAYAIYSAWPKKTRSRRVSETLEDHKRCLDRAKEIRVLEELVREQNKSLAQGGAVIRGLEQDIRDLLADDLEVDQ